MQLLGTLLKVLHVMIDHPKKSHLTSYKMMFHNLPEIILISKATNSLDVIWSRRWDFSLDHIFKCLSSTSSPFFDHYWEDFFRCCHRNHQFSTLPVCVPILGGYKSLMRWENFSWHDSTFSLNSLTCFQRNHLWMSLNLVFENVCFRHQDVKLIVVIEQYFLKTRKK